MFTIARITRLLQSKIDGRITGTPKTLYTSLNVAYQMLMDSGSAALPGERPPQSAYRGLFPEGTPTSLV